MNTRTICSAFFMLTMASSTGCQLDLNTHYTGVAYEGAATLTAGEYSYELQLESYDWIADYEGTHPGFDNLLYFNLKLNASGKVGQLWLTLDETVDQERRFAVDQLHLRLEGPAQVDIDLPAAGWEIVAEAVVDRFEEGPAPDMGTCQYEEIDRAQGGFAFKVSGPQGQRYEIEQARFTVATAHRCDSFSM